MATESYEFSGKSVEDAVAEGLKALKLRTDEVSVEVIQKGSRGIFGLGSEPAQVRLVVQRPPEQSIHAPLPAPSPIVADVPLPVAASPIQPAPRQAEPTAAIQVDTPSVPESNREPARAEATQPDEEYSAEISDDELADLAVELLEKTVELMGFSAAVEASWRIDEEDEEDQRKNEHRRAQGDAANHYLHLNIYSSGREENLNALVGRQGDGLDALQYLLRLMVNQRLRRWKNIVVDVENYKEHRMNQLKQLALRLADQVASSGRAMALEPMPPSERRIIHMTLREHPKVFTESTGEGDRRKINIVARLD